jgi:hypothetical protein
MEAHPQVGPYYLTEVYQNLLPSIAFSAKITGIKVIECF